MSLQNLELQQQQRKTGGDGSEGVWSSWHTCICDLSGVSVGRHARLVGHLIGPHLQPYHVPALSLLILREIAWVGLCLLGTNHTPREPVLLCLSAQREQ